MASFGKHLHAKQNSKLAKYADSANFAYLSKQTHNKCKKRQGASTFQKVRTKKPSAQTHNKCKKRQGASTFQKVRTKKPSAQTHNKSKKRQGASTIQKVRTQKSPTQAHKCKNAKGLRPFKRSEPQHLRHKHTTSAK